MILGASVLSSALTALKTIASAAKAEKEEGLMTRMSDSNGGKELKRIKKELKSNCEGIGIVRH